MADEKGGLAGKGIVALIILALAALAAVAWQQNMFGPTDRETSEGLTYKAGVTDVSGGELIVTDPRSPQIEDIELPKTPMSPVPPGAARKEPPDSNER
jgi:hypothetical protein